MQDTHSALRSGYGSRAAANRLQAANRSSESQLSEAGLRQSLEDEKKKVAEMSRCLQATEAKSGELQSRLDAEVARSKELDQEVKRLLAELQQHKKGASASEGGQTPKGAYFRIPEDFTIFDSMPLVVHVVDWHVDRIAMLWGNKATCEIFMKESSEEVCKIDLGKSSEQMKNYQAEMFQAIQVQKKTSGPDRRMMPLPSGNKCYDVMQCPVRVKLPTDAEPRDVCLNYFLPVHDTEVIPDLIHSKFMLEKVSSMAMMFAQENGEMVHLNQASKAHFSKYIDKDVNLMSLQDVLNSFEWEEETEIESTMAKIKELEIGQGAVVIERAVKQSGISLRCSYAMPDHANSFNPRSPQAAATAQGTVEEIWLNLKFIASLDPSPGKNQRVSILVSGADVSEQRHARQDLIMMNNQQEQFFAEMAHELRTPLHCISGLSEGMVRDATCPHSLKKNLSIIKSQSMRLSAMVSDIVDSASNMRKTLLIKHEEISLHTVAQSAVDTMATLVKRGVKLLNEVPSDLPVVQADSSRMFQVLVNLVGNSLRFTAKGHVKISGRRLDGAQIPSVELSVTDTGIGIPEDKIEDIFGAFQQVDTGTTRKYGGTGLGLALVKTLVEAHHGSVSVQSKYKGFGSGTTFVITLPVLQPHSLSRSRSVSVASRDSADLKEKLDLLREEGIKEEAEEEEELGDARARGREDHTLDVPKLQRKVAAAHRKQLRQDGPGPHPSPASDAQQPSATGGPQQPSATAARGTNGHPSPPPHHHRSDPPQDDERARMTSWAEGAQEQQQQPPQQGGRGGEEGGRAQGSSSRLQPGEGMRAVVMQRALEHALLAQEASERREQLTRFFARQREEATISLLRQLVPQTSSPNACLRIPRLLLKKKTPGPGIPTATGTTTSYY